MNKFLASVVALALTVSAANSADLYQPQPEPILNAPEVTVTEAGGWYLRGDVGYSFNKLRGAHFMQGGVVDTNFATSKIEDSATLGAGVGYQFNNHFRSDLTFDYLTKSNFKGSTRGSCGVAVDCISADRSYMQAYSLMANAYVDIATFGYVTPYVGAGIGTTYVNWNKLRNTSCDASNPASCDPTFDHDGKGGWRFSYALMAGASIDITCNLKADVGYRYRHVNGGNMFGTDIFGGGPGKDKGFDSHEARVGARYVFGGCDAPQSYEPPPAPIVYK